MSDLHPALARAEAFCKTYSLRMPILLAPMAGACPASLSIAVANAGGSRSLRDAADGAGGDQGLGLRSARRQQRRLPAQPVDSRSLAAARRRGRGRRARLPRAMGSRSRARGRRRDAARFFGAVRGDARGRPDGHFLDHGALSAGLRREDEGARDQMARRGHDGRRGEERRARRRRRDRRARHGGGRPSRRVRCGEGRERHWSGCFRCCRRWSTR